MAKRQSLGERTSEHLLEMVEEASEHRANVLENVAGLVHVGAADAVLAVLANRGMTRFLLEDEISLLRLFVQRARKEDCRLN